MPSLFRFCVLRRIRLFLFRQEQEKQQQQQPQQKVPNITDCTADNVGAEHISGFQLSLLTIQVTITHRVLKPGQGGNKMTKDTRPLNENPDTELP